VEPLASLEVDNYQSLGRAELALGGFNVIVGRGNLGKSALLRALAAAIFNDTGTDVIRRGEKETRVRVVFHGGTIVDWVKPVTGAARYEMTIDGKKRTFTKLGASVPDEVRNFFGIRDIEIDKTFSIRPQVHGQFDQPLLLAESAGKAARALAKLTKLEIVVQAQVASARDLRRAKQETTARDREIGELEERVAKFPDMDKLEQRIAHARELIDAAGMSLERLAEAEEAWELLQDAQRRLDVSAPSVVDLTGLTKRIDDALERVELMERLDHLQGLVATRSVEIATATDAESEALLQLESFLAQIEVCPVCGQPISKDHADD